ncbi:dihydrodipicolinate synthase family protein [Neorhizobium sp. NCHU2750]|uniref:dihydrodipicolinate synthase family protein n=1 Tax=Neorhizobium sp. NCHU2750 TaxID=1825976 RepID=UPI000E7267D9|nr:4-hydroxy-tetrahydrodipicolinate synthase [Neorhizobium sp. NCHU2750]
MTALHDSRCQIFTPLLTPFSEGVIDVASFEEAVDRQIVAGVNGVIVGDVIGEGPALSEAEQELLLSTCISRAGRHLSVIVATGTNCTATTVERCRKARDMGADALLVTVPYYSKPVLKGVIAHFRAVAAAIDIPVIVDDDPGRTAKDFGSALLEGLADLDIVRAVCHGPGRLANFDGFSPSVKSRFMHLSRDDAGALPFLTAGGSGLVSPIANIIPSDMQAVVAMSQDRQGAFALSHTIAVAVASVGHGDVAALKEASSFIHQSPADTRLPLVACEPETTIRIRHGFAPFARFERCTPVAA